MAPPMDEDFDSPNLDTIAQESNQAFRIRVIYQLKALGREITFLKTESDREDSNLGRSLEELAKEIKGLKGDIDGIKSDSIRVATIITIIGAIAAIIVPLIWGSIT